MALVVAACFLGATEKGQYLMRVGEGPHVPSYRGVNHLATEVRPEILLTFLILLVTLKPASLASKLAMASRGHWIQYVHSCS